MLKLVKLLVIMLATTCGCSCKNVNNYVVVVEFVNSCSFFVIHKWKDVILVYFTWLCAWCFTCRTGLAKVEDLRFMWTFIFKTSYPNLVQLITSSVSHCLLIVIHFRPLLKSLHMHYVLQVEFQESFCLMYLITLPIFNSNILHQILLFNLLELHHLGEGHQILFNQIWALILMKAMISWQNILV